VSRILALIFLCYGCCLSGQDDFIERSGDVIQLALPGAALASTFIWKDESKPTLQFLKTGAVSFVMTQSLKVIIDRERPNGNGKGFPSGHASSAFTGAASLQKRFGWKVGVPSYLLAGYVGWTRVETNNHDYWDVLGGATIGIVSAYLFMKPYHENRIQLSLSQIEDDVMVQMVMVF